MLTIKRRISKVNYLKTIQSNVLTTLFNNKATLPSLEEFKNADPFPHCVIDNFLSQEAAFDLYNEFPRPDSDWYEYNNIFEKKRAIDRIDKMPSLHALVCSFFNSSVMIQLLENITQINGLIPDPWLRGGGLHQIMQGGKLDIHADFNVHQYLKLDRRLNVLLYLNYDWKKEYGGHLELWNHNMTECRKRILPVFNRLVIFETTDTAYHGHPDPVTCPETTSRKSLAFYYYTNGRPQSEWSAPHSTKFVMRPTDQTSKEIEELRQKRNQGRLK